MSNQKFPLLAAGLGFLLALVFIQSGSRQSGLTDGLPLLTLLFLCEIGLIVTLIGGVMSGILWFKNRHNFAMLMNTIICLILSIYFIMTGIYIWSNQVT
ncbi:MAG: hypothetical protein GWN33_06900 [Gammaproteobacteria bacterium]|nr:hypothetical protein [Gammaproteobacteria bacterium]